MTRIDCRQLAPRVGELEANCAMSVSAVEAAAAGGADVIVLPELVTSGYMFASPEEAQSLALTPEAEVFKRWAAPLPEGAVVIGGFCEQGDDGRLYNSAAVVDRSGVIAVYRKVHLWDREKLVFEPGAEGPVPLETAHGRIGVLICYDLEFPEMPRLLALSGAEMIAVPTNWPLFPRPDGERAAEVYNAMAAARVNRVFVACCDRSGTEREQDWVAGTGIADPDGWLIALPDEAGSAAAEIDLERARDKSLTELADVLGDRRPELYGGVAAPGQPV